MIVELHLLQNFVPSNLNRDDTGSPKDCEFGGFRRARISSQCLKRAMRQHVKNTELLSAADLGHRTGQLLAELAKRVADKPADAARPTTNGERQPNNQNVPRMVAADTMSLAAPIDNLPANRWWASQHRPTLLGCARNTWERPVLQAPPALGPVARQVVVVVSMTFSIGRTRTPTVRCRLPRVSARRRLLRLPRRNEAEPRRQFVPRLSLGTRVGRTVGDRIR